MMTILFTLSFLLIGNTLNSTAEFNKKFCNNKLQYQKKCTESYQDTLMQDSITLITGWYFVVDSLKGYKRQLDKTNEIYYIYPNPIVTVKNFQTVDIYYNNKKQPGLFIRLDKEGTENWSKATDEAAFVKSRLAFILDNRLLQIANVISQITNGQTSLTRECYTSQELETFATIIKSER